MWIDNSLASKESGGSKQSGAAGFNSGAAGENMIAAVSHESLQDKISNGSPRDRFVTFYDWKFSKTLTTHKTLILAGSCLYVIKSAIKYNGSLFDGYMYKDI